MKRQIIPIHFFSFRLNRILSQIKANDTLILFDYLKFENIDYILKHTNCQNIHLWYWNTVNKETFQNFQLSPKIKIKYHTFDPNDSQIYSMILHNQLYRYPDDIIDKTDQKVQDIDFLFIGMDKGRMSKLQVLNTKLSSWGYKTKFIVVGKRLKEQKGSGINIQNKEIDYNDVISLILRSNVLVDITKENQAGLTLRTLEGLFFNKKVLTNNLNVKNYPFYDKNNYLFINNEFTKDSINEFLSSEYKPCDDAVRKIYDVNFWLNGILNSKIS